MGVLHTTQHGSRFGYDLLGNLVGWLNGVAQTFARAGANMYFAAGSALTLTIENHNLATIKLDTLTGSTVTLPAARGTGAKFRFLVTVLATSNSHIVKVANATDIIQGIMECLDSNLATVNMFGFAAGATADTITLDRTNTGSVTVGEWFELEDVAAGLWAVHGVLSGAAPATPFSATVS
jgi:hypothetical protein